MDVGTVDDGSGSAVLLCCLNGVDASGFRLKPGDLGVGQKFNTIRLALPACRPASTLGTDLRDHPSGRR